MTGNMRSVQFLVIQALTVSFCLVASSTLQVTAPIGSNISSHRDGELLRVAQSGKPSVSEVVITRSVGGTTTKEHGTGKPSVSQVVITKSQGGTTTKKQK